MKRILSSPHFIPLLVLTLLTVVSYPVWLGWGNPGFNDLGNFNIPQRSLLSWFYHHGELPLWNPFQFGGQPFLAAGQSGPLYLPNLVYLVLPFRLAISVSYIFHELLLSLSMYFVVFRFSSHRLGALVGSLSFVDSGFFVGHQIHTELIDGFAWLPLAFLISLKLLQEFKLRWVLYLAAIVAMTVYSGYPYAVFSVLLTISLYAGIHFSAERTKIAFKRSLALPAAFLFGLLLSAAQWLPTFSLTLYSTRSSSIPGFLLFGSLHPVELFGYLAPYGFDKANLPWESFSYIGVVGFVVALALVFNPITRKNKQVKKFAVLGGMAVILMLGKYSVAAYIIPYVPGFDLFRLPARYVFLLNFVLAILSGMAFADLYRFPAAKLPRTFAKTAFALLVLLLCMVVIWVMYHIASIKSFAVPLVVLVSVIILSLRSKLSPHQLAMTLAIFAVIDLVDYAANLSQFTSVPTSTLKVTQAVTFLRQQLDSDTFPFVRALDLTSGANPSAIHDDRSAAFQIPVVNGYDALYPKWYPWGQYSYGHKIYPQEGLNLLDVKYSVTKSPQNPSEMIQNSGPWKLVRKTPTSYIWENPDSIQAAWIQKSSSDPSKIESSIKQTKWTANMSRWDVQASANGEMVISQLYDPYWIAYVNGKRVPVVQISSLVTGIPLHSGNSTVTFKYVPTPFYIGVGVSLFALMWWIMLFLLRGETISFLRRKEVVSQLNSPGIP